MESFSHKKKKGNSEILLRNSLSQIPMSSCNQSECQILTCLF